MAASRRSILARSMTQSLQAHDHTAINAAAYYSDLAGAEAERRFSPFCWRTKMALAHKGLEVESVPWRFTEKEKLPQPNGGRVPVVIDGGQVVHDSSAIADYLETRYPDRPSLFGGEAGRALSR